MYTLWFTAKSWEQFHRMGFQSVISRETNQELRPLGNFPGGKRKRSQALVMPARAIFFLLTGGKTWCLSPPRHPRPHKGVARLKEPGARNPRSNPSCRAPQRRPHEAVTHCGHYDVQVIGFSPFCHVAS